MIVVCGPAGIGKSSLLAAAADASGLRVLRASGSPLEQDAGWGIARQLFASVRDSSSWTGAAAPARRALDADFVEPALAGDAMHAAAHGLTWLACGLADRSPTLLVVDDVHWADAPSLRWLVQLSRRLGDRPLGVLGAVRSGDPPASPGLLAELLAAAPESPVRPGPLGPEAVAALVGKRLPTAKPSFALACHAVTAGNPFLLGALLAHVVAEQIEPSDEVGARLGAFGPEQVARVLDRQLERLPPGAADLARAFAVLGRAAPLRQAAALAGLDAAAAALTADRLGEAGLLRRAAGADDPAARSPFAGLPSTGLPTTGPPTTGPPTTEIPTAATPTAATPTAGTPTATTPTATTPTATTPTATTPTATTPTAATPTATTPNGGLPAAGPPAAVVRASGLTSAVVPTFAGVPPVGLPATYSLVHPLVAAALQEGLAPAERAWWHGRAAAVLAAERADPEAVALHLMRAEPARSLATVRALRSAARRAGRRGALESAEAFLRRALAEPPDDPDDEAETRADLGLLLATQAGPEAAQLLGQALDLATDPARRARLALAGGRALGLAGYFDDAFHLCRRGLQRPDGVEPFLLARIEAELIGNAWTRADWLREARIRLGQPRLGDEPAEEPPGAPPEQGWPGRAGLNGAARHPEPGANTEPGAHAARAEGRARGWSGLFTGGPRLGDAVPVGRVNEAWIALYDGRPVQDARGLLDGALDDERDGDSILRTTATIALIACGELEAARERCGALIDVARAQGWLIALAHGGFLRAMAEVPAGRIDEAGEDARMAYEFKRHASPPVALIWSLLPLADVLIEQDELDAAEEILGRAVAFPGSLTAPMLWERRGRLRLAQRRPAEAHAELLRAAAEWDGLGMLHPALASWRVDDCIALAELGEIAAARERAGRHLERARQVGIKGPVAAGLRAAARVAPPDEATELLTSAAEMLEGSPFRLELVRALVDLGAVQRRAGQRAAAREPLGRALDLAGRGGMRALANRARAELLAAGARPRRTACSGWEALTPAERRVATLAAGGCGNREIAQQLFVTRRTVETHLTHAFQKLGVTTRAELAKLRATPAVR